MKVALIADAQWLGQERATLRRIVVGLVDEMVRVVRIAPEPSGDPTEQWLMSAEPLWYRPTNWGWWRDRQVRAFAPALREMEVDVVHALDGSLDAAACGLSAALGVPVVCTVWSMAEVGALRAHGAATTRAYVAGSRGLAEAVRRRVGAGPTIECVPPGVYAGPDENPHPPLQRVSDSICCVVIGNGRYDGYYRTLLAGISKSRQRLPGAMYFFYTTESDQHQIWQAAEQLDLLEQVSLVPTGADARRLMTQADVLLQPQPLGAVRTVVLEAMAAARPIIAAADPLVDHLINGGTARLLREPDSEQWAQCLVELAERPGEFAQLGRGARQHVLEHHKASAYSAGLCRLYERLAVPEAIPFR